MWWTARTDRSSGRSTRWSSRRETNVANTNVTVLLPRRTYAPVLGRLLHDRTADKISKAVSRIPDAAATIVPYDVQSRIREAFPDILEMRIARQVEKVETRIWRGENQTVEDYEHPERSATVIPVDNVIPGRSATVEGRVSQVEDIAKRQQNVSDRSWSGTTAGRSA